MLSLLDFTLPELQQFLEAHSIKKFRAKQIFHYVYKQDITVWEDMVQLPKQDRQKLQNLLEIYIPPIVSRLDSANGETVKLLVQLADGQTVETVLMRHNYGNSICLSSQVGCAVNCLFCASAKNGFVRNLTMGEMQAQLLAFRRYVTTDLHSVVLMGTGEPLLNYDNVLRFLRTIHEAYSFYLGYRNMTISTAGIVPQIYKLAQEGIPVNLAVSLHASNHELRRKIMPIADTYAWEDIVRAAFHYFAVTGRKVTFEYILIRDLTCTPACAEELAARMAHKNVLINAIPINDNYDVGLRRPTLREMQAFVKILKKHHISVTLRREMGSEIQAACGQLRIQREAVDRK